MREIKGFVTIEQQEIQALRAEVDSLKLELQSLSENLTVLMQSVFSTLESGVVHAIERRQYPRD